MDHLNTRTELINFICEYAPSAIQRACHTGTVQVLGGFIRIPPYTQPGWIVAVTSIHGRTWFVAIGPHPAGLPMYVVWTVKQVPWQFWIGDEWPNSLIFNGDNPERAVLAREAAKNG